MPELPDIESYVEALRERVVGAPLLDIELKSPFLLRTAAPPPATARGRRVERVARLGKRVVLGLEGGLYLAIHLMIAGRLHWIAPGAKAPRGGTLQARFLFPAGALTLTEAGTKRRAALHLVEGERGLAALARAGVEPLEVEPGAFAEALRRENHTLKRALTDPDLFSGIGNAYSDEILHRARLSPVKLTSRLDDEEALRLRAATVAVLTEWTARLRAERAGGFPEGVTAFRPEFAVHGKYRQPCPVCGTAVQRIVHAENETNYCPRCQTAGQLLSDRSLARLLKDDWPRTVDELERRTALQGGAPAKLGRGAAPDAGARARRA